MPGSIAPQSGDQFMAQVLQGLSDRIRALELSHNTGISDPKGRMRIVEGLLADGTYATQYLDTSGRERVRAGQMTPVGGVTDYGLLVTDALGTTATEILPIYEAQVSAEEFTTSTSYVDLTTVGPTVTPVVGASGKVLVITDAFVAVPGNASGIGAGYVGISVDGAAPTGAMDKILYFSLSNGAGSAVSGAQTIGSAYVLGGLSTGSHTMTMKYRSNCSGGSAGGTVGFGSRYLQVQPI